MRPLTRAQRFPVTLLVGAQYAVLVLYPAVRGGEDRHFVYLLTAIGMGTVFAVECLLAPLSTPGGRAWQVEAKPAFTVAALGLTAYAIGARLGAGTYSAQVGATPTSPLASIFTPFFMWAEAGTALLIYSWRGGRCSRKALLLMLLAIVTGHLVISTLLEGRLAPTGQFVLAPAVLCVFWGVVRARTAMLAAAVALLVAWPFAYQARNEVRLEVGANPSELALHTPQDRLHIDGYMALAEHVHVDTDEFPDALGVLRYGLIPRAIDTGRPLLLTPRLLGAASGASANTAVGFTLFGSLYAVMGRSPMVGFLAGLALLVGVLIRRKGPFACLLLALVIGRILWIDSVYPDGLIEALQGMLSASAAVVCLRVWSSAHPLHAVAGS